MKADQTQKIFSSTIYHHHYL